MGFGFISVGISSFFFIEYAEEEINFDMVHKWKDILTEKGLEIVCILCDKHHLVVIGEEEEKIFIVQATKE